MFGQLKRVKYKKYWKVLSMFLLVGVWLLTGWPQVWIAKNLEFPPEIDEVRAVTCQSGWSVYGSQCIRFTTSGTSVTIPIDWSTVNKIECIGAGGAGYKNGTTSRPGAGGGGGSYSYASNVSLNQNSSVTVQVGAGGSGTETFLNNNSGTKIVGCGAGASATSATAFGAGGTATAGTGFSGGAGGAGTNSNYYSGAGGGGSAGPNCTANVSVTGGAGGSSTGTAAGGGGGSNCGSSTSGTKPSGSSGGNGGDGAGGTGHGVGGTGAGGGATAGSGGGGAGGAGGSSAATGYVGGGGAIDTSATYAWNNGTYGPGGGGGGAGGCGGSTSCVGNVAAGNGGGYGGGGGGCGGSRNSSSVCSAAGTGGAGLIIMTYTPAFAPTVTTQNPVTNITDTTATGGGNVTSDGGATITERGVVWNTTGTPTTSDSKATASGTTGSYTTSITGLSGGVTYYVRAYAINSMGTSYGSQVSFTTAIISITISSNSNISYGYVAPGSSKNTSTAGLNKTPVATNNGTVAEDFVIAGTNSTNWTLGVSAGNETYAHMFCKASCTSPPTNYTALTTGNQSLATNIAANGTQSFDLAIYVPTSTSNFNPQSVNVVVTASQH